MGDSSAFKASLNGGEGTDTVELTGGNHVSSFFSSFEAWVISGDTTLYDTLTITNSLEVQSGVTLIADGLAVASGTANIYGSAQVSGDTTVDGTLNVAEGGSLTTSGITVNSPDTLVIDGTLNADTLDVTSDGHTVVNGTATISGATTVNGELEINSGGTLTSDSLRLDGGTLSVSGTLDSPVTGGDNAESLTNNGSITGNVDLAGGDDTVTVGSGASFGGTVDGGGGSDTLELTGGSHQGNTYLGFENLRLSGGENTLSGDWSNLTSLTLGAGRRQPDHKLRSKHHQRCAQRGWLDPDGGGRPGQPRNRRQRAWIP